MLGPLRPVVGAKASRGVTKLFGGSVEPDCSPVGQGVEVSADDKASFVVSIFFPPTAHWKLRFEGPKCSGAQYYAPYSSYDSRVK
ncbi:hypothetical protein OUZ56_021573 [Daphnia magna]|uniref:Uncharacterized protein n=1 Tax=Daphnia magna TaxID=35525 RepID=A0ABR0ATX9_9CRUS|nr:hypothetical protein OUZ56_021573 [Daphnia magna]